MMNQVHIPGSIRSSLFSSLLPFMASRLAARSFSVGSTLLVSSLMCLPHNQVAKVLTSALLSRMLPITTLRHFRPASKRTMAAAHKIVKSVSLNPISLDSMITIHPLSEREKELYLHQLVHKYTWTFTGKISCGDALCSTANVEIHLTSKKHPDLIKQAVVHPDGSYSATMVFTEAVDQYVDWWIQADSPESASRQLQGRQILTDETAVQIETRVQLL
jgi:hypothetical protein